MTRVSAFVLGVREHAADVTTNLDAEDLNVVDAYEYGRRVARWARGLDR